ncbi:MAG: hypothetical protein INR73_20075 [Williamsia sp.]|nr:hypothetical protein [Williamsia sp.]
MTTDQSKFCHVTNNSGKDITLVLAVNPDETSSSDGVKSANGQLEVLNLSGGGQVLKPGSSGAVTLDHHYKSDAYGDGSVFDYDLVACDTDWLYPLAVLSVEQEEQKPDSALPGYPAQTITQQTLAAMNEAASFYQTTAAYPSSQLAKDYVTTLQQIKEAVVGKADGSSESAHSAAALISKMMESFFLGTKEYQHVTQAALTALGNYYNTFPCVWAQYKDDITYYVYAGDGTVNLFAGVLSLKKSGAIDITKVNGGYTCLFIPAADPFKNDQTDVNEQKAVSITYDKGIFTDLPDSDKPTIALAGSFMLKRLLTNDPDDNSVASVVTGMVNGVQCVGLDTPQTSSQEGSAGSKSIGETIVSTWDQLTHPKQRNEWIISIVSFVGGAVFALASLGGTAYGIYRYVKYRARVKAGLAKEAVLSKYKEIRVNQETGRIKWMQADNSYIELNTDRALELIESCTDILEGAGLTAALTQSFTYQRYAVQHLLECSSVLDAATKGDLQSLLTSLRASDKNVMKIFNDEFQRSNPSLELIKERFGQLKQETTNCTVYQETFENLYKTLERNVALEAKEFINVNMANSAQIFKQINEVEEREELEAREEEPRLEREVKPEFVEVVL